MITYPLKTACYLILLISILAGCDQSYTKQEPDVSSKAAANISTEPEEQLESKNEVTPIVAAARSQVGRTTGYDPAYVALDYPGGDIPIETGVCTDVVIRALRDGADIDLQKLVHEDMSAAFSMYPDNWGLKKPDRNIDHRRVPNLQKYFERAGFSIAVTQNAEDYQPGDIVTCFAGQNVGHIMIVSDRKSRDGAPYVLHNIGRGTREENRLFAFTLTGHYRVNPN